MLILDSLTKAFGDTPLFSDFSYVFPSTGLYFISGNSGSGKTTLFRMIAGLDKDYRGNIRCNGRVSYLFQDRRLFPSMTALENVLLALKSKERNASRNVAIESLRSMGFTDGDMGKYPDELSGGMLQRVAIARAFLADADVLLLDEPTKELDEGNQAFLRKLIVARSKKCLILCATHDEDDIRLMDGAVIPL